MSEYADGDADDLSLTWVMVCPDASQRDFAISTFSHLTPPGERFFSGHEAPVIARFLPFQHFDLQATVRAVSVSKPGMHTFNVMATHSDGQTVTASSNLELIPLVPCRQKVKSIIDEMTDKALAVMERH